MKLTCTVHYGWSSGDDPRTESIEAESLEELSALLDGLGYRGPTLKVRNEAGFVCGFVSHDNWSAG